MVVIGVGPLCSLGIVKYPPMSRFASLHYPCIMTVGFIFECQSFVQKLTISRNLTGVWWKLFLALEMEYRLAFIYNCVEFWYC